MKKDEEDVEGGEEAGSEERKMKSVMVTYLFSAESCSLVLLNSWLLRS